MEQSPAIPKLFAGKMELLPIIIIVSLLGFFIIITLILFTWQYLRTRDRRRRRSSYEARQKPPRKLTLQSGKAVPTSEIQDTASTRDPLSLDLNFKPTYTVTCEAEPPKAPKSRPLISALDHGHPPILSDLEAQIQKQDAERPRRVVSEPNRPRRKREEPRIYSGPAKLMTEKNSALSIPRPALVTIESRTPSTSVSVESPYQRKSDPKLREAQPRQSSAIKGQAITNSLQKAYQGPSTLGAQTHGLPGSPLLPKDLTHIRDRRAVGRRTSGHTLDPSTVSSRVVSDSIQRPPPLFSGVNYTTRVRFAPPIEIDYSRVSFLSMTDSVSSSVASDQMSPLSSPVPTMRAPPPSKRSSPPRHTPPPLRNTPPHLETPDFGHISFFDSATSSEDSAPLKRGVSVMSNRSNFTIASSEISSNNWTFGSAKVVNIYPSLAQERESTTPPYAQKLRSKYGRYPRGRRDKALPGVPPKSPLWQTEFGLQ